MTHRVLARVSTDVAPSKNRHPKRTKMPRCAHKLRARKKRRSRQISLKFSVPRRDMTHESGSDEKTAPLDADPIVDGGLQAMRLSWANDCLVNCLPKDLASMIVEYLRDPVFTFSTEKKDGLSTSVVLPRRFAELSKVVDTFPVEELQLKCSERTLVHLGNYLRLRKGTPGYIIPRPLRSQNLIECGMEPETLDLFKMMSKQELYDMILLANYLDIPCLLYGGCAAAVIKGEPLENINPILGEGRMSSFLL